MMYQESLQQIQEKSLLTNAFLQRNKLAPHPVNYTVCYEYISGTNKGLSQALDKRLEAKVMLDDFIMAELYSRWLMPTEQQEQLHQEVSGIVSRLSGFTDIAAEAVSDYLLILDDSLITLQQNKDEALFPVISQLKTATDEFKLSQQQLHYQLELANQQSHQLRHELDDLKQQKLLDPLTGLYNRVAMQNQVDLWFEEQPDKRIAAIAINLDHFSYFNQQYGKTVGNVILSKIAQKVRSYVEESGLPVRTSDEEFLILLPDVDLRTATEIAEQVRRGVEKMRFISSRDKKALPKVTLSAGVALFQPASKENWYHFLARTSDTVKQAKQRGRNQVISEVMLKNDITYP